MENTAVSVEQEVAAFREELGGAAATIVQEFSDAARTFRVACAVVSIGLVAALLIDVVMRSRDA